MKFTKIIVSLGFLVVTLDNKFANAADDESIHYHHHHHHHSHESSHIGGEKKCGTHGPTKNEIENDVKAMKNWIATNGNRMKWKKGETVNIPTYWNTLTNGGEGFISDDVVIESIAILNAAFSPNFIFTLEVDPITTNSPDWPFTFDNEKRMKSKLRKGGCGTLNIYSAYLDETLGWAEFPKNCANRKTIDGVVIDYNTVPGGNFSDYDEGKTLIHEVGHWLGLYHTFQGGCPSSEYDIGDAVGDTPAVAVANDGCPNIDSCPDDGLGRDHVQNFMDYTDDACMNEFTAGQFNRMNIQWNMYRSDTPIVNPYCPTHKQEFMVEVFNPNKNVSFYLQRKKNKKPGFKGKKYFKVKVTGIPDDGSKFYSVCVKKEKQHKFVVKHKACNGLIEFDLFCNDNFLKSIEIVDICKASTKFKCK